MPSAFATPPKRHDTGSNNVTTYVNSQASPREHLIHDLRKYEKLQEAIIKDQLDAMLPGNEDHTEKMRKKKLAEEIKKQKAIKIPRAREHFVVSTFGTTPRDPEKAKVYENIEERKLYKVPAPPPGPSVSIPTAGRWTEGVSPNQKKGSPSRRKGSGNEDDDDVDNAGGAPSPASYNPKPVRPHSASCIIGNSKRTPTVLVKGMVLPEKRSDAEWKKNLPPPEPTQNPKPAQIAPGVAFTKAKRFDAAASPRQGGATAQDVAQAAAEGMPVDSRAVQQAAAGGTNGSTTPGPAAYSPQKVKTHTPAARFNTSPRSMQFSLHGNSFFYHSSNEAAAATAAMGSRTGPGAYATEYSSISKQGVSFPKAARNGPDPNGGERRRPQSARPVGRSPRRHGGGADDDNNNQESNATTAEWKKYDPNEGKDKPTHSGFYSLFDNSIAAKLHRSKQHATFTKSPRGDNFALQGNNIIYSNPYSNANVPTPGVGAYRVYDGKGFGEAIGLGQSPRRNGGGANENGGGASPRSSVAARPGSAAAAGRGGAGCFSRAPRTTGMDAHEPTPGPGAYDAKMNVGVGKKKTTNKFLRDSEESWKRSRHVE